MSEKIHCCDAHYHTGHHHKDCVAPALGEHCSEQLRKIVTQGSELNRLRTRDAERKGIIDASLCDRIEILTALLRKLSACYQCGVCPCCPQLTEDSEGGLQCGPDCELTAALKPRPV